MTPADIDRVFGRGRLRMVTGDHVEVFREPALPGQRRRYTKRFLSTPAGDFRHWTEREWRILARLVGHGIGAVPDVVRFDRGGAGEPALVQTYDAGVTVDHWATLLPVRRDGVSLRHVFEDCAHWWALARHCLLALDAIHALQLVHLDLKADNVCIPVGPPDFEPHAAGERLYPRFAEITLIDFAFSLVSGESLTCALPIARQSEYDYQSPRLLQALEAGSRGNLLPTRQLDWRCDFFSLAAMLRRYLPDPQAQPAGDWSAGRLAQARALVRALIEVHDAELPALRPHAALIASADDVLQDRVLAASLERGWEFASDGAAARADSPTPITRIAPAIAVPDAAPGPITIDPEDADAIATARLRLARPQRPAWVSGLAIAAAIAAVALPLLVAAWSELADERRLAAVATAMAADAAGPAPGVGADPVRPEAAPTEPARPPAQPAAEPAPGEPAPAETAPAEAALEATPVEIVPAVPVAEAPPPDVAPPVESPPAAKPPVAAPQIASPQIASPRVAKRAVPVPAPSASRARKEQASTGARRMASTPAPARVAAPARRVASVSPRTPAPTPPGRASRPIAVAGVAPRSVPLPAPAPAVAVVAPAPVAVAAPASARSPGPAAASYGPGGPAAANPFPASPAAEAAAPAPVDLAQRANELMASQIPRSAQRAERLVLRVLFAAANADDDASDDEVRRAARAIRLAPEDPQLASGVVAGEARRLNEAARAAFWRRGSVQEALGLQTRAFGANPLDAEVVGTLAFLKLRQQPANADAARQLALHALTLHDWKHPQGRIEDWTTLAIASALAGRERESRNAWLVTLAIAGSAERQCRAAMNAVALYGERLRAPVEAMLQRVHASGRGGQSSFCEWPPHWSAASQLR